MKYFVFSILLISVLVGALLRLANLDTAPPSLNWDEASLGYNAYALSQTARDEHGVLLPTFAKAFGEYKSALPIYLMIPSIWIFGTTDTAVRLPSALLGTGCILLVYLICKRTFNNSALAVITALVLAIEPWSIHFSRTYQEATTALFFFLLGFTCFVYRQKYRYFIIISLVSFIASAYCYNSNKILVPLFVGGLFYFHNKELISLSKPIKLIAGIVSVLTGIPFSIAVLNGTAFARVKTSSIMMLWPTVANALQDIHPLTGLPQYVLHNPYYYFVWEVAARYLSYFSPMNLFVLEPREPNIVIAGNAMFLPLEIIFWVAGLLFILRKAKQYKEVVLLLILSPIPAIATWNWFQPTRVMTLLIVFSICIGIGLYQVYAWIKAYLPNRFSYAVLSLFAILGLFYYVASTIYVFDSINYYSPHRDFGNWQPGFKETVPLVMQYAKDYDKVIIETEQANPYIFYLYYGGYNPKLYQQEIGLGNNNPQQKFGKFEFRKIYWPEDRSKKNTLFVGNDLNLPQQDIKENEGAHVIAIVKDHAGFQISKIVGIK